MLECLDHSMRTFHAYSGAAYFFVSHEVLFIAMDPTLCFPYTLW